jgi:hypothetical protein
MATMTITVKSEPSVDLIPKAGPTTTNQCQTQRSVFIPVPAGESRFISEIYSPGSSGTSQTQTITSDTTIVLTLDGIIDDQFPENNEFYSAYLRVSMSASDPFFYTTGITRECTSNIC